MFCFVLVFFSLKIVGDDGTFQLDGRQIFKRPKKENISCKQMKEDEKEEDEEGEEKNEE